MNGHAEHFTSPQSRLVALDGGPRRCSWFFYQDWLALRESSRRGRYSLDHPCGSSRCYLPTARFTDNTDPACAEKYGQARVWEYVPPETLVERTTEIPRIHHTDPRRRP
ncbi:hypothetical protein ACFQ1S_33710 [Kibdelosporangium lantanae]|uniref:Uncharacterized protein n=1 Tax=Kibdelosporangium lantanae TaxID=1497396 RepID=A0ABW3MJ25_9PSEU